jgi:hypothetical protein
MVQGRSDRWFSWRMLQWRSGHWIYLELDTKRRAATVGGDVTK